MAEQPLYNQDVTKVLSDLRTDEKKGLTQSRRISGFLLMVRINLRRLFQQHFFKNSLINLKIL